jgi:hypothetical protein
VSLQYHLPDFFELLFANTSCRGRLEGGQNKSYAFFPGRCFGGLEPELLQFKYDELLSISSQLALLKNISKDIFYIIKL